MISDEFLKQIVENYKKSYLEPNLEELDYFKGMKSLDKVIDFAGHAKSDDGKFKHQHRFQDITLEAAHAKLKEIREEIEACKDFDELHCLLVRELEPIHGIGELYCYDTALRIGAYLGYLPEKVYLHSGTREGAKIMGILKDKKLKTIEISDLPEPLRELEPHQIEDVLCIYRKRMVESVLKTESIHTCD